MVQHFVYIIRCADGTLYTGWTTDLVHRMKAHSAGRGAKYTKGRGPVALVYCQELADKSQALKRECAIKKLSREKKLQLIAGYDAERSENENSDGAAAYQGK